MSDSVAAFIVTFKTGLRGGQIKAMQTAFLCFEGVIDARPVVEDATLHIARLRAEHEISARLWRVFTEKEQP